MSPAQPGAAPEPVRGGAHPRTRYRRQPKEMESETPPTRLRAGYAGGAVVASIGYLAVLVTAVVRPTALDAAVAIGLLIGLGTLAALSTLAAILTWAVALMPQPPSDQQAETVEWAIRLGEDMADAYRAASAGSSFQR